MENLYNPGLRLSGESAVDYEHRMANALGWNNGFHSRDEIVSELVYAAEVIIDSSDRHGGPTFGAITKLKRAIAKAKGE